MTVLTLNIPDADFSPDDLAWIRWSNDDGDEADDEGEGN